MPGPNSKSPWRQQQRASFTSGNGTFPKGSVVEFELHLGGYPTTVVGKVIGKDSSGRITVHVRKSDGRPADCKTSVFHVNPSVLRRSG